jgi:hypothetical protein
MGTDQIMCCIVALILGMLMANMLKNVCGCKTVEGASASDNISPPVLPASARTFTSKFNKDNKSGLLTCTQKLDACNAEKNECARQLNVYDVRDHGVTSAVVNWDHNQGKQVYGKNA